MDKTVKVGMGGYGEMHTLGDGNNTDRTLRTSGHTDSQSINSDDFILKGKVYRRIKCLSDNSGEAQVFLVSNENKEYVLKVYYPNFSIKKDLLRIIANMNFELIVHLYDFGKTYIEGKNRDYELMEYLKGGTLADYKFNNDIDTFRRLVLQCAAALAYCHNNDILHKDIKPSNFFFRDLDKTEVVLGDFGISSVLESNKIRTTQARTPVYAAPEMYIDVIDGEVEITPASDYYSLGITLLTLWLGNNPLTSNERLMMRRKSEGRLPGITELPERIKMLIQGLTVVNPDVRWGYDEVERWFLGESPNVDLSSPLLRYKSFVIDPERNIVADNVHELIPLLLDNERVACGYLYGGRITSWLEQCGNVKLSTAVKDIVTNKYPADQMAGLLSAVYTMEASYPYKDIRGNSCEDVHSIAISALSYADEYAVILRNPHDRLWLYLETHTKCDIDRLRGYFDVEKFTVDRTSVMKLVYEIDKEIPLLAKYPSSTIKEIVRSFGNCNVKDDDWQALTDGRLLAWMHSHEDNMACESLRIMTDGQPHSRQLAYKVLYNIDRNAAYDLKEADTPHKLGELLSEQLCEWQTLKDDDFADKIADYADPNGRFAYFAQLHGWFTYLDEAVRCFNLKSDENRDRLSAYDLRTASYRFCCILGVKPQYKLQDGVYLTDGLNIESKYRSSVRSELRSGCFAQWLSIFYHEDPSAEFKDKYSYERRLEEWLIAIGNVDPMQTYYKRYETAKMEMAKRRKELKQGYRKMMVRNFVWRLLFYSLLFIWLMLVLFSGITGSEYLLSHSLITIGLPVGGVTALIMLVRYYFKGYGYFMCIIFGILGFITSLVPITILKFVNTNLPNFFIPAVILLSVIYAVICYLTDLKSDNNEDKKLITDVLDDDIKSSLIEPLYYAFKTKSYKFKGSKFGMYDDIQNQIRSVEGESVIHYILWCLMYFLLIMELIIFSPNFLNIKNPEFNDWQENSQQIIEQIKSDIE